MTSWAAKIQNVDEQAHPETERVGAYTDEPQLGPNVRPDREIRMDFEEVKVKQAARVSLLYIATAAPVAWYYLPGTPFALWPFMVFSTLVITGLLSWHLTSRSALSAYLVLLIGPVIAHALALWSIPSVAVPFFGVLIVVANAAISPWHGLGAALLDAACLWYLYSLHPLFWPLILLMALVVVAQFILYQSLYTYIDWSWNSQQRANTLLEQLRDHQGRLNRALTALTEATRRLQRTNRELALARQDADEARALREQFVVNISHELRTPLNLIVGFVEMMYLSSEDYDGVVWTPELSADIGRMYRAGNHLESLVNDILDLSRIDTARLPMFRELISLRTIIDEASETIAPLLEPNNLSYEMIYDDTVPNLLLDRTRIRQVMLNLLNNAIRFTDEGRIVVNVRRAGEHVEVSVKDTGVGIPSEQIPHIFEKFTQAHVGSNSRGGAGLGLALSKQFVWLHGGSMWVESTEGQGSTFTFTLPLPGASLVRPQELRSIPPRLLTPEDAPVIVADPDAGIAEMLGRYIGDRRVLPLRDIRELDGLIEGEHPCAVIHNLLPDAPAQEWLTALGSASARYNVPILRCSIPSPSWLPEMSGIHHCLTKPVSRADLEGALQSYGSRIGRLLIVDDDPGFVSLIERMVSTMGLVDEIRMVYSGAEALRLYKEYRPDVILLDLYMPDIDGFAVVDALHARDQLTATRVIAITASSYGEEMLVRKGTHFTLTQAKGLSTGKLTDILHAILDVVEPDYVRVDRTE
jgi:signal transduction histidine kinase/CheY-like chemotaxis protein